MNDAVKVLLLAGGGGLLLWQLTKQTEDVRAEEQSSKQQQSTSSGTAAAPLLPLTDETFRLASWDHATAAELGDRHRYNVWQWNYVRHAAGRPEVTSDLAQFGDPAIPITAAEYLARLHQSGLAGLGRIRRNS